MTRPRRRPAARPGPPRPEELARRLADAPLFSSLSPGAREALARHARVVALTTLERLWSEGDEATSLALVLVGRLKLIQNTGAREVIVDLALPGDLVGEVAFALGSTYRTSAVCLRRARVLVVPAAALRAAVEREPGALTSLAANLAGKVQRLMRLVQDLSSGSVERRLARVLVGLAERCGVPFPGGTYVPIRLRRADLAALAATTEESVIRKLGSFTRRGWVRPQPVGYLLRDLEALRRVAEEGPEAVAP